MTISNQTKPQYNENQAVGLSQGLVNKDCSGQKGINECLVPQGLSHINDAATGEKTVELKCSNTNPLAIAASAKFLQRLADVHEGRITLCPGQVYVNNKTKVRVRCSVDGHEWEPRPVSIINEGKGCPACKHAAHKARKDAITAAFIGQTTPDGHVILEHVGYTQCPAQRRKGELGNATYRYRCAVCGNEEAVAAGGNLKKNGHTTHCGCQKSNRESINKHLRNEKYANSLCMFYIWTLDYDSLVKIGITNNMKRRFGRNVYRKHPEEKQIQYHWV